MPVGPSGIPVGPKRLCGRFRKSRRCRAKATGQAGADPTSSAVRRYNSNVPRALSQPRCSLESPFSTFVPMQYTPRPLRSRRRAGAGRHGRGLVLFDDVRGLREVCPAAAVVSRRPLAGASRARRRRGAVRALGLAGRSRSAARACRCERGGRRSSRPRHPLVGRERRRQLELALGARARSPAGRAGRRPRSSISPPRAGASATAARQFVLGVRPERGCASVDPVHRLRPARARPRPLPPLRRGDLHPRGARRRCTSAASRPRSGRASASTCRRGSSTASRTRATPSCSCSASSARAAHRPRRTTLTGHAAVYPEES